MSSGVKTGTGLKSQETSNELTSYREINISIIWSSRVWEDHR